MGVHKSGQVLKPAFHHVMQLKEVCPLKWTDKKGSLSAIKSMNILIKNYDLTGTLYLNRIKEGVH